MNLWNDYPSLGGSWDLLRGAELEESNPPVVFDGRHPQWTDTVSFRQNNLTFQKGVDGDLGSWSVDGNSLILIWDHDAWGQEILSTADGGYSFEDGSGVFSLQREDVPEWWLAQFTAKKEASEKNEPLQIAVFGGVNPHWSNKVIFEKESGHFEKDDGDGGSWQLIMNDDGTFLELAWSQWGIELLAASVDVDVGRAFGESPGFTLQGSDLPTWWFELF